MGLKKLAAKVAEYNERLDAGKARKIKPDHVEKVLKKLRSKEAELKNEIAATPKPEKRERLMRKLGVAQEQITRAEWLLKTLS